MDATAEASDALSVRIERVLAESRALYEQSHALRITSQNLIQRAQEDIVDVILAARRGERLCRLQPQAVRRPVVIDFQAFASARLRRATPVTKRQGLMISK